MTYMVLYTKPQACGRPCLLNVFFNDQIAAWTLHLPVIGSSVTFLIRFRFCKRNKARYRSKFPKGNDSKDRKGYLPSKLFDWDLHCFLTRLSVCKKDFVVEVAFRSIPYHLSLSTKYGTRVGYMLRLLYHMLACFFNTRQSCFQ
jgi:hypothetical protein